MTAEETLEIVSKQWCSLEDLMKISQVGRNSALKIKRNIREKLTKQGYMVMNKESFFGIRPSVL